MTATSLLQLGVYLGVLLVLVKPLGWYMAQVFESQPAWLNTFGRPIENLIFGRDQRGWEQVLEFHRRLHQAGYLALHWPKEWGGGGAGIVHVYPPQSLAAVVSPPPT